MIEPLATALDRTYQALETIHDRQPAENVWQEDQRVGHHPLPAIPDGTEVTVVHNRFGAWATTVGAITTIGVGVAYVGSLIVAFDNIPTSDIHRVSWRADL